MAQPFVGEIRIFAGSFAPQGWLFCDGALLAISEYTVVYSLVGTTYGGDGVNTFALPNLQGRVPVHTGINYPVGQLAGAENVTLGTQQMPAHNHVVAASQATGDQPAAGGNLLAASSTVSLYNGNAPNGKALAPNTVSVAGGSQPHSNQQPYLCLNFIIAIDGIYPSPS